MDLFDTINYSNKPLSLKMRPKTLEDFVGQEHILYNGSLLNRAIKTNTLGNSIFYGPPGTGKTSLASIISETCKGLFVKLNAINVGVAEVKKILVEAKKSFELYGKKTFLILEECHRWSKAQSDSLLEAMEDGSIVFIGTTTENPYFSLTRAVVSRCRVFEFFTLTEDNIRFVIKKAIIDRENGFGKISVHISDEAISHLCSVSGGDVRSALNALELAVLSTPKNAEGDIVITKSIAEECIQKKAMSIDESMSFDLLSAFCKSLRGSDAEAALYYSNRLIASGFDPLIIARRLVVHSSEDIGMADSNAVMLANTALQVLKEIGMPEGNMVLAHAIIYVCEAPKSNSVKIALNMAKEDVNNKKDDKIPPYLKNNNNLETENPMGYKYPHNFGGYVKQQYLPDSLADRIYYKPSNNGAEKNLERKKK